MSFRSPLTDCTNAALQAMNCITSTPGLVKKTATTYTHKPYITGLIEPSECSSADEYDMIYSPSYSNFSTPQRTWYTEPNSPAPSSPYTHTFNSFSASPDLVERSLFRSQSKGHDDDSGNFTLSHSPVTLRQLTSSPHASAARCMSAEVKVQLRSGEDEFLIKDLHKLFGPVEDVSSLVNSYVVVEGDRGEDMGCIVEVLHSRMGVSAAEIAASNLKKVLRASSPEDIAKFANLDKEEKEAVEVCCKSIRKVGLNVDICIEGAVFQFDKKKLTIQYTADGYVDFTQLTRILHNCYKCRIWMDQLNRSTALQDKKSRQKSQVGNNKRRPAARKNSNNKQ